jgi:predicted PurR-regulated permease PerM
VSEPGTHTGPSGGDPPVTVTTTYPAGATPARPTGPTPWLAAEATIAGRLLVLGLTVAGVAWVVLQVKFIAAAVVLGLAEVALLWPLARWLRARHVPRVLAAIACVLLFLAFFAGLVVFVATQIVDAWPQLVDSVTEGVKSLNDWLQSGPLGVQSASIDDVVSNLESSIGGVLGGVTTVTTKGLAAVGNLATVLIVATFFTIFALTNGDSLWRSFLATLPRRHQEPSDAAFRAGMRTAGNWFYASTLTGLIDGIFIGLGLYLLHVPLAIPIGALTFILGYVPLVGATIAGAIAIVVAAVSGGISTALWALLVVVLVQQIEGNVLQPLLMSRALSFHPLVTLLLTTGAAAALGLLGLFLAVPVAGVLVAAIHAWRAERAAQLSAPTVSDEQA